MAHDGETLAVQAHTMMQRYLDDLQAEGVTEAMPIDGTREELLYMREMLVIIPGNDRSVEFIDWQLKMADEGRIRFGATPAEQQSWEERIDRKPPAGGAGDPPDTFGGSDF